VIVRDAIRTGTERLSASSETARLDAELLMAHALGEDRQAMLLNSQEAEAPAAYAALLARRATHEPVSYIIGMQEFWSLPLIVRPGVLIPRPDSETLIEAALAHCADRAPDRILDLGTGSGALLLAALSEWPEADGLGVDCEEVALDCARHNAERLGFAERAHFMRSDWGQELDGRFDLVLCNPPYVESGAELAADVREFEPASALFAGPDGLSELRKLAPLVANFVGESGLACVEVGAGQADAAAELFRAQGLKTAPRADLAGHERCLVIHS
jgi:release factor glutamine methyltransferase